MAISRSPSLRIAATIIGTMFLGFGIAFTLQPGRAIEFFEFEPLTSAREQKLANNLILLYSVRDIFMGLATYAATYYGDRRALGWIIVAASAVGFADGFIVRAQIGKGQWSHWSYAPVLTAVGSMLLGVLD